MQYLTFSRFKKRLYINHMQVSKFDLVGYTESDIQYTLH